MPSQTEIGSIRFTLSDPDTRERTTLTLEQKDKDDNWQPFPDPELIRLWKLREDYREDLRNMASENSTTIEFEGRRIVRPLQTHLEGAESTLTLKINQRLALYSMEEGVILGGMKVEMETEPLRYWPFRNA